MPGQRIMPIRVMSGGLVTILGLLGAPTAAGEVSSFTVERGVRQLFLDDAGLERVSGLKRVVNQPVRHVKNPIVRPDRPWDTVRTQLHGSIIYRPDLRLYQMWYLAWAGNDNHDFESVRLNGKGVNSNASLVGYATSKDGVNWEKPNLGQVDFNGSTDNNLIKVGRVNSEGFAVIYQPDAANLDRRYKAVFWSHSIGFTKPGDPPGRRIHRDQYWFAPDLSDGIWAAFSPDGVHWTNFEGNPICVRVSDSGQAVVWDPERRIYAAYSRYGFDRRSARIESPDFEHWSDPELVFEADKKVDGEHTQVEGISLCIYEGRYIGLPWMRYNEPPRNGREGKWKWSTAIQLLVGDDGKHWARVGERATFLGLGPPGAWDDTVLKMAHQPVVLEDRILIYYTGYGSITGKVQIGLATLRRDGWASLDAGREPGTLLTGHFKLPTGKLHLNADTRNGEVRVAILDDKGTIRAESARITGDALRAPVIFSANHPPVGSLIRLRITAENAKLYSYWFE